MTLRALGVTLAVTTMTFVACGGDEFSTAAPTAAGGASGTGGGASGTGGTAAAGTGGTGASGAAGNAGSTGGIGGASGASQGGTAGAAGGAGAAGNAGTAGGAGSSGSGGSAGQAGSGGASGTAGSAGTGGGGKGGASGSGAGGSSGASGGGSGGASGSAGGPTCAQQCVPAPPAGWLGLGFVDDKPQLGCGPDWPDSLALFRDTDIKPGMTKCDCSCDAPSGVGCRTTLTCGPSACFAAGTETVVDAACTPVGGVMAMNTEGCKASTIDAHGGSCKPQSSGTIGAATWSAASRACLRASGGGCANGDWCVPPLPALAKACIVKAGVSACPSAYPNQQKVFDGKLDDTRACGGTCTCDAPAGASCSCGGSCSVDVFSTADCGGSATVTVTPGGSCITALWNGTSGSGKLHGATASGGMCTPSGAATVVGAITPSGPITVCCAN